MAAASAAQSADTAAAARTPAQLWELVQQRYDAAQRSQAASTTETHVELCSDEQHGISFVLRVAAALRDKPKPPPPAPASDVAPRPPPRNPFLPPEPALTVAPLPPAHLLLLNKFNIVAHHLLVVTQEFQSQLDPMTPGDWAATWAAMQCMPQGALAFYNCGPQSGASQPHRHMQLVPLPLQGDAAGDAVGSPQPPPLWPLVAAATAGQSPGQPAEVRTLPFVAYAARLPAAGEVSGRLLAEAYSQLLACAKAAVSARSGGAAVSTQDGSLSYNVVATAEQMLVVPRRAEAEGPISCNAVAFAGSFFVRSREELQFVRSTGPMRVLAAVGYEW